MLLSFSGLFHMVPAQTPLGRFATCDPFRSCFLVVRQSVQEYNRDTFFFVFCYVGHVRWVGFCVVRFAVVSSCLDSSQCLRFSGAGAITVNSCFPSWAFLPYFVLLLLLLLHRDAVSRGVGVCSSFRGSHSLRPDLHFLLQHFKTFNY